MTFAATAATECNSVAGSAAVSCRLPPRLMWATACRKQCVGQYLSCVR
jgi:hypothetical protein